MLCNPKMIQPLSSWPLPPLLNAASLPTARTSPFFALQSPLPCRRCSVIDTIWKRPWYHAARCVVVDRFADPWFPEQRVLRSDRMECMGLTRGIVLSELAGWSSRRTA